MKYLKCIMAFVLCVAVLCIPFIFSSASATALDGSFAGIGEYTAHLLADPSTATPPAEFGTVNANGKVWVDKSVAVNKDRFEITLSALAQEYISEDETVIASATAADVVMLLDMSGSMDTNLTLDGETMKRTKAMVKAVNEAVDIILSANEKNRVLIYTYQGSGSSSTPLVQEFLPLGHYTNTSWTSKEIWNGNNGKYFNYLTSDAIQTARNLKRDGANFSQKSISTGSGTYTQSGLSKSIGSLVDSISSETKTVERKPYVLLFTDGAPGCAHTTWYNVPNGKCNLTHSNDGTAQITALTVLSASLMKNKLSEAYQTYNGKSIDVEWFNIGLGVSNNLNGTLFLNPKNIATDTSSTGSSIRSYINSYTSGQYSSYNSYSTNYVYTENSYLANSGDALREAFKELADKVENETKTITFPIVSTNDAVGDLVFTDVLGEGLKADDITLYLNPATSIKGKAEGDVYAFEGYETTVALSTNQQGRQVLTWIVPAKEIAIFSFADRKNPTNGNYVSAEPLRLRYNLLLKDPQNYKGAVIYSNEDAKAQFTLSKDNTYYHDEQGNIKENVFTAQTKSNNLSGTNENYLSFNKTVVENTNITAKLGNNGVLKPVLQLQKDAESDYAEPNTDVSYILQIKNVGNETLNNVKVTDVLPSDLSYKAGSSLVIEPTVDGQALNFLIPKIEAGQIFTINYKATLSDEAENFKNVINTAEISEIHTIEVYDPVEETSLITVKRFYKVNYEWTGDIPTGVTLPTDAGCYPTGEGYSLDQQFTNQTKIENKDAYNNVIERWTFSGWNDPNAGIMGESDITIPGIWSYESFDIPANKVIYTWSGDIPNDVVLPNDSKTYVKNQPYSVDSQFTAQTVVPVFDDYNNVIGRYSFSGWVDPNAGVMGETDIIIPGVWRYESVTVEDYIVTYVWSGDIPNGVNIPLDENRYVPNQTYEIDATYSNQTTINDYDAYGNVCGYWSFSGWNDPNNAVMGHSDITIEGVWEYIAVIIPDYKITYVWSGDIPNGVNIPLDENRYVPNQTYEIDATYSNQTTINDYDAYGNVCGKWTFSGWSDPNNGVTGNADITIPGVWTYETVLVPDYKVIYTWSGDIPANVILPTDANKYVTNQPYTVDDNFSAQTVINDYDQYGNVCGYWSFSGWNDPNNAVMGHSDITIEGVWEYIAVIIPDYKITYVWSGDIPSGVNLPLDENRYVPNQTYEIDATYSNQTTINDYDAYGNICGYWSFSGWNDPNNAVMGHSDITIEGVWEYIAVIIPDYKITYVWSGDIPNGVNIPLDENRYVPNQTYEIDATYSNQTTINYYDAYGNVCGKWTFSGWSDPNNGVMGNADITIPGIWTYETVLVPDYKVIYTWSGDIPANVILPTDANKYVSNQPYTVDDNFSAQTVVPVFDDYNNVIGRYSFSGWADPNAGVMGETDITIPGVWRYESVTVEDYIVTYVWSGDIPSGVNLPLDENRYVTNQGYTIDGAYNNQTIINDYDASGEICGRYSFSGWHDPNNGVMGNNDVTVEGVWKYEEISKPIITPDPEVSNPETSEPETSEPDNSEPDNSEPDNSDTVMSEPNGSNTVTSEPEEPKPEISNPEEPKPNGPQTGDNFNLKLVMLIGILSLVVLIISASLRKKIKA